MNASRIYHTAVFFAVLTLFCSCCGTRQSTEWESVSIGRLSSREDNITHIIDTVEVRKFHFVTLTGDTVRIHDSTEKNTVIRIHDTTRTVDTIYSSSSEKSSHSEVVRKNGDWIFKYIVIILAVIMFIYIIKKRN